MESKQKFAQCLDDYFEPPLLSVIDNSQMDVERHHSDAENDLANEAI